MEEDPAPIADPSWWQDLGTGFMNWLGVAGWDVLQVAGVVAVAILLRLVLQLVIRRTVDRVVTGVKRKHKVDDTRELSASPVNMIRTVQRTRALGGVFSNAVTAVIVLVSILLCISIIAPDTAGAFSLITAALGAGLGFGAQNIVKDLLNGIFIVSEDQLGVGDVVDLGLASGVVESVTIRTTQVRDVNGTLWFVRNGEILRVGNKSYGWARVIIDLAVPYTTDLEAVEKLVLDTAVGLARESKWRREFLEDPQVWGIESISSDALVLRLVAKTRPSAHDDVTRELQLRLRDALEGAGITLPALTTITLDSSGAPVKVSARRRAPGEESSNAVPDSTVTTASGSVPLHPRSVPRADGTDDDTDDAPPPRKPHD